MYLISSSATPGKCNCLASLSASVKLHEIQFDQIVVAKVEITKPVDSMNYK